ncbi:MAG: phage terminase large subunit [Oscillospiraceae bacterium]|nr:phage terminase large subunit [Oscillospiraceae bacterium]
MDINWKMSDKQKAFCCSSAFETLFGGAAGGGKSYVQLMDAMLYALKYPASKQLILRRTFPELEKSLIRTSLELYPNSIYRYNGTKHTGTFVNGSLIDFGYCDRESDVYKYQSAQYDVIRFDELTHFTEYMYTYLISRVRGANSYPKCVKSCTNPGGIGHSWVKARFIDPAPPMHSWRTKDDTTRLFIPASVFENKPLMDTDPDYINRLRSLPEKDRKALLYGRWDIFEGQFFSEFSPHIHVVKPFAVPPHWKRYFCMDYGLDMLAAYVVAVDTQGRGYVIKELCRPNLIVSRAAQEIKKLCEGERIEFFYAPPDMWNRRQETGRSVAEIFFENGIMLAKSSNDRESGWLLLKEWLKPFADETGGITARLVIFENCTQLIRCLPALTFDSANPNDVADIPHDITHSPDAIRYFVAARPAAFRGTAADTGQPAEESYEKQVERFVEFGT